jgi:uncharacterized OB-fold protein
MTTNKQGGIEAMEGKSEIVEVKTFPFPARFDWATGLMMQTFIQGLAKKRILGAKCPECGYTYVPPRSRCGKCYAVIDEKNLVDLAGEGTLVSYTEGFVRLDGNGNFQDLEKPVIIGAIKLDGADSTLFMPVEGIGPQDLKEGLGVKVQWREETKGELSDIKCFAPVK